MKRWLHSSSQTRTLLFTILKVSTTPNKYPDSPLYTHPRRQAMDAEYLGPKVGVHQCPPSGEILFCTQLLTLVTLGLLEQTIGILGGQKYLETRSNLSSKKLAFIPSQPFIEKSRSTSYPICFAFVQISWLVKLANSCTRISRTLIPFVGENSQLLAICRIISLTFCIPSQSSSVLTLLLKVRVEMMTVSTPKYFPTRSISSMIASLVTELISFIHPNAGIFKIAALNLPTRVLR
mmetsp:Transcript_17802/g.30083  ORF Transcript_17802/g.30083 Transcript_17802/m.30083 type:complete len:235 (+) Transcript_17802:136-840(+)